MRSVLLLVLLAACTPESSLVSASTAEAQTGPARPGQPAPAFTLPDLDGRKVSLSDYAGHTVVLEWFNPGCPFVRYAHGDGPLETLPQKWIGQGVTWLAINSGAPGKQGTGVDTNKAAVGEFGMSYPVLLDESGTTGRAYGARSTPTMVVIDGKGVVAYLGALDNAPLGKPEGGTFRGLLDAALTDLSAGRAVATPSSQAYGCSVKYE